jgi:hypothetical protein
VQGCLLLVTEVRPGHRSGRRQYALRYVGPDDQMLEVLAKPVKLPDDEDVAGLDGLETSNKAKMVVVPEGRKILGDAVEVTPPVASRASRCGTRVWLPLPFESRM